MYVCNLVYRSSGCTYVLCTLLDFNIRKRFFFPIFKIICIYEYTYVYTYLHKYLCMSSIQTHKNYVNLKYFYVFFFYFFNLNTLHKCALLSVYVNICFIYAALCSFLCFHDRRPPNKSCVSHHK